MEKNDETLDRLPLDRLPGEVRKVYLLLDLDVNAGCSYTVKGAYPTLDAARAAARGYEPYTDLAIAALDAAWSWRRPNAVEWTT